MHRLTAIDSFAVGARTKAQVGSRTRPTLPWADAVAPSMLGATAALTCRAYGGQDFAIYEESL